MWERARPHQPKLLLLDEPTSSLDIHNQYQVLQITRDLCREQNLTAMIVIHDLNLALRFCDRFLLLREGEVYRIRRRSILPSTVCLWARRSGTAISLSPSARSHVVNLSRWRSRRWM